MSTMILIPARMASTRLPGKPLADIGGRPMIVRVAERGRASGMGPVVVATDTPEIAEAVRDAGFEAVLTGSHHQSGSDRIHEALKLVDPAATVTRIVNLQGDLPLIEPGLVEKVARLLDDPAVAIATACAEIASQEERNDPNIVKFVGSPAGARRLRALYFTRATAPWGEGPLYHHIGIYAYQRAALDRFVSLAPSTLERRERLEQLRALEDGMRIDAAIVDTIPFGVDTPRDLERARRAFAVSGKG
jgi:3-deoxy-manno-octulosonate cytidylyltransferase (CMP-KDO synthetase)